MRLFKNTNYNFVRFGRAALIFSGILIAASIVSLVVRHGLNMSIDFVGGLRVDVKLDRGITYDELSKIRSGLNVDEVHTAGKEEDEVLLQSKGTLLAKDIAEKIYQYRSTVGSIRSLDEIRNIPGMEQLNFKYVETVFTVGEVKKETTTKGEEVKEEGGVKPGEVKEPTKPEEKDETKPEGGVEKNKETKPETETTTKKEETKVEGGTIKETPPVGEGEVKTEEAPAPEVAPVLQIEKTNINGIDMKKMVERFQEVVVLDLEDKIKDVFGKIFASDGTGPVDLNSLETRDALTTELFSILPAGRVSTVVDRIAKYRNFDNPLLGVKLISSFDDLKSIAGLSSDELNILKENFRIDRFVIRGTEVIGPRVSGELTRVAALALLYAIIGMLVYIGFRFDFRSGLLAIVALIHDVIITLGFCSIFNIEMSLVVLAALLTVVGYSTNDTVVYYDRIREGLSQQRKETYAESLNRCINENLSRTMLTGLSSLIVLVVLFFKGGQALKGLAFVLIVGIIFGTYSSVYVAAPLLIEWDRISSKGRGGRLRKRKI